MANKGPQKEGLILNGICLLLSLASLVIAVMSPITGGISIDTLFVSVVGLTLAAIFALNPVLTLGGGVLKELMASVSATQGEAGPAQNHKVYYMVWGGLLTLTVIEIGLIFPQLNTGTMLMILISLSGIKSALIMYYFMHLKFERKSLRRTLLPITIVLLMLFAIFFPDSYRSGKLRTYSPSKPKAEKATEK
ncbi:MAG: cytochrome C oxidase subunit IV family protein [Acidobacteriota bacterium]